MLITLSGTMVILCLANICAWGGGGGMFFLGLEQSSQFCNWLLLICSKTQTLNFCWILFRMAPEVILAMDEGQYDGKVRKIGPSLVAGHVLTHPFLESRPQPNTYPYPNPGESRYMACKHARFERLVITVPAPPSPCCCERCCLHCQHHRPQSPLLSSPYNIYITAMPLLWLLHSPDVHSPSEMKWWQLIVLIITFDLSDVWEAKFFILCGVIFLVRLQGNLKLITLGSERDNCLIHLMSAYCTCFLNENYTLAELSFPHVHFQVDVWSLGITCIELGMRGSCCCLSNVFCCLVVHTMIL